MGWVEVGVIGGLFLLYSFGFWWLFFGLLGLFRGCFFGCGGLGFVLSFLGLFLCFVWLFVCLFLCVASCCWSLVDILLCFCLLFVVFVSFSKLVVLWVFRGSGVLFCVVGVFRWSWFLVFGVVCGSFVFFAYWLFWGVLGVICFSLGC